MDYSDAFSENLVRLRKEKGISQKELAKKTNISPRMIAHYEKHVSHPSLEKIQIIATALNVTIIDLMGLNQTKKTDTSDLLTSVNTKTLKQFKKILKLNPIDRSTIYKMVDGLLGKPEYSRNN